MTSDERYLSAAEAAAMLEISVPTLYAYVSRGLIRSEATEGKSRARRYRREDVDALLERKSLRRDPAQAVETALHFGAPVLESAITLIEDGRLYYRGHDVLTLTRSHQFEEVAALIWGLDLEADPLFPETIHLPDEFPPPAGLSYVEAFQMMLPLAAAQDWGAYDLSPAAVAQSGARIVALLTAVATGRSHRPSIAQALQQAWVPQAPQAVPLINTALILCADHELNVSSFTARCVASAAGTPYGVVLAGLAALQGAKHGGYTERVEALFKEAQSAADVPTAVLSRLRRGESLPGFGHKLYPQGDPRARLLLDMIKNAFPKSAVLELIEALEAAALQTVNAFPVIDFALVALARTLQLPPQSALALFALGRTAGWIGHAIEQYQRNQIIRPRARYVGVPPV
ncbi:MAG: citrate synthase family protein [Ardenticatenaceae bacterium]|nr:citrate synthase family protein [Ardenticatenaceae bacterium]